MRIGCKAHAKRILEWCGCRMDCYRGVEIASIEEDLTECFKEHPNYNGNNYPIHDLAIAMREIGDETPFPPPPPPPPKYCMIFDGGDFVDGINFDKYETAKEYAIDTLCLWMAECCNEYKMSSNWQEWTEEQINEWDYLIYNSLVEVAEYNEETKEYDIIVWYPSYEDKKTIGWMPYEEFEKTICEV